MWSKTGVVAIAMGPIGASIMLPHADGTAEETVKDGVQYPAVPFHYWAVSANNYK